MNRNHWEAESAMRRAGYRSSLSYAQERWSRRYIAKLERLAESERALTNR